MMVVDEEDKIKILIRYCHSYRKTGRVSRCAKLIGRSLSECECTVEDIRVAKLLLKILDGELNVNR